MLALDQLGIAASIINSAFILILGGLALAFGLAFGLGGREHAARYLSKMEKSLEEAEVSKEKYKAEKESIKDSIKKNVQQSQETEQTVNEASGYLDEAPNTGYNIPSTDDLHPYEDLPPSDERLDK